MMPAAKHGDPQLGIDVHLCVVPPAPAPVPLPTPHTSIVFDPFDYVPFLGATVTVCGMKRATAGTAATAIHIPPGFPFAPKLPDTDDEIFMGSSTVVADGDPFTYIALPVLSCQVAGMISPPRLKKKGPPNLMILPTTVNLAIPTSVVVGGPPTISLMGMLFKGAFAALGKFAKSGLFKRMRKALFKKMDPGFLKCTILRAEPVNILTGAVAVDQEDFTLPGRIPLEWVRSYSSSSNRKGLCGVGWETIGDIRLEVDAANGTVSMIHPSKGPMIFERLPVAPGEVGAELELIDGALLSDHETEFQVRTKEDRIYHFPKKLILKIGEGTKEYVIEKISDLCGNTIDFERRALILTAIRDSAGRRLNIQSELGHMTEVSMDIPDQETPHVFIQYEYDLNGDLVSVIDALGHPYTFAYDDHHMIRHTDRNGLSFYYDYQTSANGERRVNHAWGDGGLYNYQFEYVDVLNERRITDSLGHVSIIKLNESGLPISEIDPLGGITSFEYDDRGRTTAVIDQEQNKTQYEYDDRGNLLKLTRPDGCTIETEFNLLNKALIITDPNGALWEQKWNECCLLIQQKFPLGSKTFFDYDSRGQLVGVINPMAAESNLSYDGAGHLIKIKDAAGYITHFNYDLFGNITTKIDPIGQNTHYVYDVKGRYVQAILSNGAMISCEYDKQDNLVRYIDQNGAVTCMEYYGQGEIAKRIQPDGHSIEYKYDTEERLISVVNQRGQNYEFKRDALGYIIEEVDYWGQSRYYSYLKNGFLKESTDPLGQRIHCQTNALGYITKKSISSLSQPNVNQTEDFEYDKNGNLVACENVCIRIERVFDSENQLVRERQGNVFTIKNDYDLNGNRITRTTVVENKNVFINNTVKYQYDDLNHAGRVEVEGHSPLEISRNALGQVTQETLGSNLNRFFEYNSNGDITSQRIQLAEGPLLEQDYLYSRSGQLIKKHDSIYGIDQYTYDPMGRLVSHLNPEKRLTRYLNDPAGDRLQTRIMQPIQSDVSSPSNWLREGEYEGIYYRFDGAGNLTERYGSQGGTQFNWEPNKRLNKSTTNGKTTVYHYDPFGRRVSKETDGVVMSFFWDGDSLLGDLQVEGEVASASVGATPKTMILPQVREWVYYPETFEPLFLIQSLGQLGSKDTSIPSKLLYLYHNDPIGCPTRLLDPSGHIVWDRQNLAWGGMKESTVRKVDNPLRFQGQYEDEETGLFYNRYRYYDPKLGAYVSQDPIGLGGGVSLYAYVPDPNKFIDPLGLAKKCGKLSDPNPIPRAIREAYEEIKLGNGVPRIDPATGRQTIHRAAAFGRGRNVWRGALEWDVPGTRHRILERTDGRLGYVLNHEYRTPRLFPAPWYPDGG